MPSISLSDLKIHKSAAKDLRKAVSKSDSASFQKKMLKTFGQLSAVAFDGMKESQFASTVGIADLLQPQDVSLFELANHESASDGQTKAKKTREQLIANVADRSSDKGLRSEFEMLLAMELLVRFGDEFSADQFVQALLSVIAFDPDSEVDASDLPDVSEILTEEQEAKASSNRSTHQMLRTIVRYAEIPFTQSVLLEFLDGHQTLRKNAVTAMAQAMEASTDNDGTVHSRLTEIPERWLAPFIRINRLSTVADVSWAKPKTVRRWVAALEYFAALTIHTGWLQQVPSNQYRGQSNATDSVQKSNLDQFLQPVDLLSSALAALKAQTTAKKGSKSSQNPLKDSSLPDIVQSLQKSRGQAKKKPGPFLDWYTPSTQSDWAASALLRTGFEPDANSILIDWDDSEVSMFMSILGSAVMGGPWITEVRVNDQLAESVGDWTCTCWFQDDDVAFAELERGSTNSTRHVRHVMLHLQDHFAVLCESATSESESDQVSLRSSVPLPQEIVAEPDKVTREIILKTAGPFCRVIPAWLPDDRVHSGDGDCRVEGQTLESTANGSGGAFLPLVLDWSPKNTKREADWTKLTVSEEGQILNTHKAAAVRTRVGRQQLMLYRSFRAGDTLRTVLGHHTANETVYGKFTNDGEVEPLVMVEPTADA